MLLNACPVARATWTNCDQLISKILSTRKMPFSRSSYAMGKFLGNTIRCYKPRIPCS